MPLPPPPPARLANRLDWIEGEADEDDRVDDEDGVVVPLAEMSEEAAIGLSADASGDMMRTGERGEGGSQRGWGRRAFGWRIDKCRRG